MRAILFRGKRKDNGEWTEGYLVMVDPVDMPKRLRKNKAVIMPIEAKCNWFNKYFYGTVEVLPETIGQFTGLADKNGAKVFEGDVLRTTDISDELLLVIFNDNCASFQVQFSDGYTEGFLERYTNIGHLEVVGNIHDNPKLLEEKV